MDNRDIRFVWNGRRFSLGHTNTYGRNIILRQKLTEKISVTHINLYFQGNWLRKITWIYIIYDGGRTSFGFMCHIIHITENPETFSYGLVLVEHNKYWHTFWSFVGTFIDRIISIELTQWGRITHICVSDITIMLQTRACRLVGAKPLSEPMLGYC